MGRGFWLVTCANVLEGIGYYGTLSLLTLYLHDSLRFGDISTGWLVSIYTGLVTLFMLPGGALCDRLGARATLRYALALLVLGRAFLLLGWAPAALLAMALGTGAFQPAVYAGVKETTEKTSMGYAWLFGLMNAGVVAWSVLSPDLRARLGIAGVYQALLGLTLVNLALQALPTARRPLPEQPTDRRVVQGSFLAFIFLLVPVRMLVAHLWLTFPTVLQRAYAPEVAARTEWCQGLNSLVLAVATPLLAGLTGRLALIPLMIGGTALSALSVFVLLVPGPGPLLAYLVLFSLGEAIWAARFYEYVADTALPGRLGAAMGVANFPWFVAKTLAGAYSGAMLARFVPLHGRPHPEWLWIAYGLGALVSPVGLWLGRDWLALKDSRAGRRESG